MKLTVIRCDCGTQSRAAINEEVVGEYAERMVEGDKFPPAEIFFDGNEYYLADGFHRILAATRNGFLDFECNVRAGTLHDALWFAIGANRINGVRRNPADKRRAVAIAIEKFPNRTGRQIAEHVGCSHTYVQKVHSELATSCQQPVRRTGKDGKQYASTKPRTCSAHSGHERPAVNGEQETSHGGTTVAAPVRKPEEIKHALERSGGLKSEVEYHMELVKADSEIILERLRDCTIEPGDLMDCEVELRFAAKKVEALRSYIEWPNVEQSALN